MTHGTAGYFHERARFERRVSLLTLAVGLGFMGGLWLLRQPTVRHTLSRATARFGYEGPNQYVRRINLQQYQGTSQLMRNMGAIQPLSVRKGGDAGRNRSEHPGARPVSRARLEGPGNSEREVYARGVSRLANVPVVRSEELVIERLIQPIYPEALIDRNIEGKVTVQALIDTTGRVVDVQLMASTGEVEFERAAQNAVWQCRFRPYRVGGTSSEVYAIFRFSFRIY